MNGPSHPGSPPTVASGNQNGEQYAFQVINTGGICQSHLYLPNFLLPAGGAMTITDIGLKMSSGQHFNQTYEVWCKLNIVCLS